MTNNLSILNRTLRLVTGFSIIVAVLSLGQMPTWLLLLSTYPIFTAIINWDPFYAIYKMLNAHSNNTPMLPRGTRSASA